MPRYPEINALLKQALLHTLSEQEKLLGSTYSTSVLNPIRLLNELAVHTNELLGESKVTPAEVQGLIKLATAVEQEVDEVSESLWIHIPVSVTAIYERLMESLERKDGVPGLVADIRAHYHNLRIRLLNQLISAGSLSLNNDLGDEHERIWQQFLERQLGPKFKVLRGGHIYDHDGQRSGCQVDLIVVPAGAQVILPGDSEGGKASVLIDQVISAVMITSTLTTKKLEEDWRKVQSLPSHPKLETEFPHLKGHPWPLCYIMAAQGDAPEELKKKWQELSLAGLTTVVPQFVVSLDSAFLYCGLRRWPAPRFPGNYVNPEDVAVQDDIFAGLGLAWVILQQQGRLAAVERSPLGAIQRFGSLLDNASMPAGVPATYSRRFETWFDILPIAGMFKWGCSTLFPNNKVRVSSLSREITNTTNRADTELFKEGIDAHQIPILNWADYLRWFRFGVTCQVNNLIAFEEWIEPRSKENHRKRIAVFNTLSGEEITGSAVTKLNSVHELNYMLSNPGPS